MLQTISTAQPTIVQDQAEAAQGAPAAAEPAATPAAAPEAAPAEAPPATQPQAPVEQKPAESKPAEAKPADGKAEDKKAEDKKGDDKKGDDKKPKQEVDPLKAAQAKLTDARKNAEASFGKRTTAAATLATNEAGFNKAENALEDAIVARSNAAKEKQADADKKADEARAALETSRMKLAEATSAYATAHADWLKQDLVQDQSRVALDKAVNDARAKAKAAADAAEKAAKEKKDKEAADQKKDEPKKEEPKKEEPKTEEPKKE